MSEGYPRSHCKAVFILAIVFASFGFLFFILPPSSFANANTCESYSSSHEQWISGGTLNNCTVSFQDLGGSSLQKCQYQVIDVAGNVSRSGSFLCANLNNLIGQTIVPSITVGVSGDCQHNGLNACKLQLNAIDNSINASVQTSYYYNVDFTPPMTLATNASSTWFSSGIATLSVSDSGGSGVAEARYSWTNPLDASCASGGTVFTDGTFLSTASGTMPAGSNVLHLCARDKADNAGTWNGQYNIDPNPPTISAFNVSPLYPNSVNLNQPMLAVSWSIADIGGSHLQEVAIWRAPFNQISCSTGGEKTCNWGSGPEKTIPAPDLNSWDNTQSPYSYSPTGDGIYWYGMHVADKAGNEVSEWSGSGGTLTVQKVRIKLTNAAPTLSSVAVSPVPPNASNEKTEVSFSGNWTDPEGDSARLSVCKTNQICSGGNQDTWCTSLGFDASSPSKCSTNQTLTQGNQPYFAFECQNGGGCSPAVLGTFLVDTSLPTIKNFTAKPLNLNSITVAWDVSDTGGSHLQQVEVWRTPLNQNNWAQIQGSPFKPTDNTLNNWSSSAADSPGSGAWEYGLHVVDFAGNVITESTNANNPFTTSPNVNAPISVILPSQPLQSPNQAPQAINLTNNSATANYCSTSGVPIAPPIILSWVFQDLDEGDYESAYQIQIAANPSFSNAFDSGQISVPANTIRNGTQSSYAPPAGTVDYATTYYWRVQVWDSKTASSGFVAGNAFSTPSHYYPIPDFTWSPASPGTQEKAQFTDLTNFSPSSTGKSWSWNFGDNASSSLQNPIHAFAQIGSFAATLQAQDNAGSCAKTKTVNIGIPFPQWQEISPF